MQNEKKNEKKKYDLKVEKTIDRPVSDVFRALGEGRLFLNCGANDEKLKIDFRVGGKYHLDFLAYKMTNHGEFLEIIPNRKIVFTWCQDPMGDGKADTTVTLMLKADGAQTHLTVLHEGFKDQEKKDQHEGGWNGGLGDLAGEMVEGKLRFVRYFEFSIQSLYEKCANPSFFSLMSDGVKKVDVDFKVGGSYRMPRERGEVFGKFLEIDPGNKIVFTYLSTKVTLGFEKEDEEDSWLSLTHEGLTDESEQKSIRKQWDQVLSRMLK